MPHVVMVGATQSLTDLLFNPIFGWLLDIPPILAILFLSLLLGLVSTLLQKYLTNQAKLKRLRDDTKKMQKQMKELKDPEKVMKMQQKMLPIQMEMMKESFKPLLVTMIPFLLVFFWLSHHFAFHAIAPNEPFTVTAHFDDGISGVATLAASPGVTIADPNASVQEGKAVWELVAGAGEYDLNLTFGGQTITRSVLISSEREYVTPKQPFRGAVTSFDVDNKKLLPLGDGFNLFGWYPGWIAYYILLSIPISLGLKKLLNVV